MIRNHHAGLAIGCIVFLGALVLAGCPTEPPVVYTVTYDANGADGGTAPTDANSYETGQAAVVLGKNDLVSNNKAFSGWNTAADGSGVRYREGNQLTIASEDVTLYAEWLPVDYTDLYSDANAGLAAVGNGSSSFADVDGDGDQDLLITGYDAGGNETAILYENDGTGSFTDAGSLLTAVAESSTSVADVDGDGDQDLVISGWDGGTPTTTLYTNDGTGNFSVAGTTLEGVIFGFTCFADVNGDDDKDLLLTGIAVVPGEIAIVYSNNGAGVFTDSTAGLTGVANGSGAFADVNGNGHLDLVIAGRDSGSNETASLYMNDGDGNFSGVGAGLTGVVDSSTCFGDVDGDGDQDLLITGENSAGTQTATLYSNNGVGDFSVSGATLAGVERGCSDFADVDADGDLDLLIAGFLGDSSIAATLYINDGSGDYTDGAAGLTGVRYSSCSFADVDGDGDQDLVITGETTGGSRSATLYLNSLN